MALALGCAAWGLKAYFSEGGAAADLVFGLGSVLVAVGLFVYERYVLRKLKRESYL